MPDFAVRTAFTATDKLSPAFNKMGKGVDKFGRRSSRAFKATSKASGALFNKLKMFGSLAVVAGVGVVARQFVKFDDAIFGATARFKDAQVSAEKQVEVMDRLRVSARKVGAETQFTAEQAAQGLNKFALAGFTSEEAIKSLRSQIDLATVTGEDFMQVADQSTDLLGAFGGNALKSADKVAKLKQMNALLAVATLSANVTLNDLFETLKQAAPIGTKAGLAMKDIIATASVLGSAGIKGSMAATTMKNMFARLAAPTAEVKKGFKALGLEQADFINDSGKLKNTTKIFESLAAKTKDMGDVEALGIFKNLFGLRGMAGAAVLEKNIGQLREQLIRMGKDPRAEMERTAEFIRQSLGNRLKILGSTVTDLGFKFFEAFSVDGKNGIDSLTEAIRAFDPTPLINGLRAIGTVLSWLGALFDVLLWPARNVGRILGGIISFYSNPEIEKAIIRNPEMLEASKREKEAPNKDQLAAGQGQTNININNKGVVSEIEKKYNRNVVIKGNMGKQ